MHALSEAVVSVHAAAAHSPVARVHYDVTDYVTEAVAQQQGHAHCAQKQVPRRR